MIVISRGLNLCQTDNYLLEKHIYGIEPTLDY